MKLAVIQIPIATSIEGHPKDLSMVYATTNPANAEVTDTSNHNTRTILRSNQATRSLKALGGSPTSYVGAGFVASLARPGGNATGFTIFEYGMSGKVSRVDPDPMHGWCVAR
jgi:hypothetical protein